MAKRKFQSGTNFRHKWQYWAKLSSVVGFLLVLLGNGNSRAYLQTTRDIEPRIDIVEEGNVRYPLAGLIAFTNTGDAVTGMRIECFTQRGRHRIGTTYTDASGHFSFPKLPEGRYLLKASMHGVITIRTTVNTTKKSKNTLQLVAEAIDCEDPNPGDSGISVALQLDSCR